VLEVKSLVKHYTGERATRVRAVDDVSFSVPQGALFTLLGPSGCGKTTTLRSIAGLERPDAGEIAYAGRVVYSSARRTFVLCGDGELQEGSMWEAAMAAGHFGLDRLVLIVDRNGLQQGDVTERTMRLDPLADRFTAFGWSVRDVDGHDHAALLEVFGSTPFEAGKPNCVIARTHKGHGVSFISDQVAWHHHVPNEEEYQQARSELEAQLEAELETELESELAGEQPVPGAGPA